MQGKRGLVYGTGYVYDPTIQFQLQKVRLRACSCQLSKQRLVIEQGPHPSTAPMSADSPTSTPPAVSLTRITIPIANLPLYLPSPTTLSPPLPGMRPRRPVSPLPFLCLASGWLPWLPPTILNAAGWLSIRTPHSTIYDMVHTNSAMSKTFAGLWPLLVACSVHPKFPPSPLPTWVANSQKSHPICSHPPLL